MKRVPFTRLFSLAARQLLRDARAGELRVLFFALLVAVAASSAIGYFSARLNDAMLLRASEFLAADLRLSGSTPASQEQIDAGLKLGLDNARAVEFSSVVAAGTKTRARPSASCRFTSAAYCGSAAARTAAVKALSSGPPRAMRASGRLESTSRWP